MPNELASRLEPIVADAVTAAGFELDALEVQQAGRRKLVKVVVDGEHDVGLDEVAEISRSVSTVLDANEHLLAGAYTLEVTSPGLDRPLTKPRHWRRARHRKVRVTPREGSEFVGRVGVVGEHAVQLLVAGSLHEVAYSTVVKAVVEVEFRQPPAAELEQLAAGAAQRPGSGVDSKEESR